MKSRFSLILITCVVVFGGILLLSKKDNSSQNNGSGGQTGQLSQHLRGEGKKKVTLTEYGDFQCPACGAYYPLVEQVFEKYKTDITFQYRNFPLRQIHPNAMQAHRSAYAADQQGKFWEMYNLLYQNQTTWSSLGDPSGTFRSYAESLGLDLSKYDTDVKSLAANDVINADIAEGNRLGVSSTPTFFLNGKKIDNPKDVEAFERLVGDAIKNAQ